MGLHLDRVDAVPVMGSKFEYQFENWLAILVNVLNENLQDLDALVLSQNVVVGTTQTVELNSIYIPTNLALTTFAMPALCDVGRQLRIAGFGAGGWKLLNGSGQTIHLADTGSTAVTSIASSSRYDSIELICVEKNLTWISLSTQTSGFVIV